MHAPVLLPHRSVLAVSGPDAEAFLNGILTVSTLRLAAGERRYGALLTPQGKVIADLLIERDGASLLIDCAQEAAPLLEKRLTLMKLRAEVAISARPELGVIAFTGAPDPRSPLAPHRLIAPREAAGDLSAYHSARLAAGLAEQGADFFAEEVFPADINMDLLSGVDFKKGCFVGQEVVSRMKRRATARRRTLRASVAQGPAPAPVLAGLSEIGVLTSVSGGAGLARVRIDRLAEAEARGEPVLANNAPLQLDKPAWLAGELVMLARTGDERA